MWLHAADVRSHALQRLNKTRERKSQLAEWQVAVFDGMEEAKGTSWWLGCKGIKTCWVNHNTQGCLVYVETCAPLRLGGFGELRLLIPKFTWQELDLVEDLRNNLIEIANQRQTLPNKSWVLTLWT